MLSSRVVRANGRTELMIDGNLLPATAYIVPVV